jgi:uncharacterized membrane protein YesL
VIQQVTAAFRILRLAFRDTWQELWTILIVHLLFLLGNILIITGPPATLALFFYGNKIAHGETANEREFLEAIRKYWAPAWRWGLINLLIIGLLTGDYYLIGNLTNNANMVALIQGLYVTLLVSWLLLQLFALPFLFEQKQPSVFQALRNATVFIGKNLIFVLVLALLLGLSLTIGTLAFMLTFVFGGAFLAFAGNHAVLEDLAKGA